EQGDFLAAARVFDRARAIARDDPDVQTVHARFLFFTRGPIASLEALQPLLERHPEAAEAWSAEANCYVDLQNTRLAAEAVDRAIRLQPRRAAFYRDSAQIRHQVGALAGAERLAREAVRLAPEDPLSALVLAQVLLDRGASGASLAEARDLLKRARRADKTREPA